MKTDTFRGVSLIQVIISMVILATAAVAATVDFKAQHQTPWLFGRKSRHDPSAPASGRRQDATLEKFNALLQLHGPDHPNVKALGGELSFFQGSYTMDESSGCIHSNPYTGKCTCGPNILAAEPIPFVAASSSNKTRHHFVQCFVPHTTQYGQFGGAFLCNSHDDDNGGESCDVCVVKNPATNACQCPGDQQLNARRVVVPLVKNGGSSHSIGIVTFCAPATLVIPPANTPTPVAGVCLGDDDPNCFCNTPHNNNSFHKVKTMHMATETPSKADMMVSFCVPNCTHQGVQTCGGYCAVCLSETCYDPIEEQCCTEAAFAHTCPHENQCCISSQNTVCCSKEKPSCCTSKDGYAQCYDKKTEQCCAGEGNGPGTTAFVCGASATCCPRYGAGICCEHPTGQCCTNNQFNAHCYGSGYSSCGNPDWCFFCPPGTECSGSYCDQQKAAALLNSTPTDKDRVPPPKKKLNV